MKTKEQRALIVLVRTRQDFQQLRKSMTNRLGVKADGTDQNLVEARAFPPEQVENFQLLAKAAREWETKTEKMLLQSLKTIPAYTEWLSTVVGVGTVASAWLLGSFDIEIATTPSKMWQYAGLNPGMVPGKKRIAKAKYKPEMGTIVAERPGKDNKVDVIIHTTEMVRGDRLTPGFVSPFNRELKTALVGVLASNFIKAKAPYAMSYYYPYKHRLEHREDTPPDRDKAWKDDSKGHRDMAAKRYMIKQFLRDFYVAWRTIEGLPVRPPYQEEYLGHRHEKAS